MSAKRFAVRGAPCAVVLLAATVSVLAAQNPNLRSRMLARGLPRDLVSQVSRIAAEASAMGLPTDPLADKAIEGYAKHVPEARIVVTVRSFAQRMGEARTTIRASGVRSPNGTLIAAAAEAMSRGLGAAEISAVVRAAPNEGVAAPSLLVAAALAGQGMEPEQATSVVTGAIQSGRSVPQILDMPGAARALQSRGMTPSEISGELLNGALAPAGSTRPGGVMARPMDTPRGGVRRP